MSSHPSSIVESLESRTFLAGQLDPAFNSGAILSTAFSSGSSIDSDVEVLPDGGFLAAGTIHVRHGSVRANVSQMALAKFNFDGTLDTTFGDGGKIAATPRGMLGAFKIDLTPDGGFIVMGGTAPTQGDFRYETPVSDILVKFTADGKIDTTFGKNGELKPDRMTTFTVDPQGRILIGAFQPPDTTASTTDATLTRYTAAGKLDTSFNKTGQFISAPSAVPAGDFDLKTFNSIAFDTQGRILASVLTETNVANKTWHLTIYRLTPDGKIDRSYASNGKTQVGLTLDGGEFFNRRIAGVLDDGSIILIGRDVVRVDPDGQVDSNYGKNGIADTTQRPQFLGDSIYSRSLSNGFLVSPDGSVVFAGDTGLGTLQLTRINPQGKEDTSFGPGGTVTVEDDPDPYGEGYLNDVAIAPDGSILCGGQHGYESPSTKVDTRTFVIARVMSGEGPALQLVPRTLKQSSRYCSISVLIRDPDGVDTSTLDNNDLKLVDSNGDARKFRFLSSEDVNGDGKYIRATYHIIGPNVANWSSAANGTYEVRLQRKQIKDSAGNSATAQVLGTVRVKIP